MLASHLAFIAWDERMPLDLGLYYKALPAYYEALGEGVWLRTGVDALGDPGGWYNLALALWLHAVGRSGTAFQAVDVIWLSLGLVATARIAWRLGGPWASFAAASMLGATPMFIVNARRAWIHVPETALVLLALLAAQADPGLRSRRTVLWVALWGALAVALRPSALVWVGSLLPLLWWGVPRAGRRGERVGAILVAWALAAQPPLLALRTYLEAKAAAVERYEEQVPALGIQIFEGLGLWGVVLSAAGLLLGLRWRPEPVRWVLLAWIVVALGLWAGFKAGIDNFLVIAPALAIAAGVGLARAARALVLLPVVAVFLFHDVQWAPTFFDRPWVRKLPAMGQLLSQPHPLNHYRVAWGYSARWVTAMFDASCPDRTQPCVVATDQGLSFPYTEGAGQLFTFLSGYDWVELVDLRAMPAHYTGDDLDALVHFEGDMEADARWRERYPRSLDVLHSLTVDHDLRAVWTHQISRYNVYWLTPSGALAAPEAQPEQGFVLETPIPLGQLATIPTGPAGPGMGGPGMGGPGGGGPGMGGPGGGGPGGGGPGMGGPGGGGPGGGGPGLGIPGGAVPGGGASGGMAPGGVPGGAVPGGGVPGGGLPGGPVPGGAAPGGMPPGGTSGTPQR